MEMDTIGGDGDGAKDIQFSSAESACCKINIKRDQQFKYTSKYNFERNKEHCFSEYSLLSEFIYRPETLTYFVFINKNFKPPKDIPVLYSSLLVQSVSF